MTTLGPDLSHHQTVNMAQVPYPFVVLKATEGNSYVDPTFAARRAGAHAAGKIVGIYHFSRNGNVAAEAGWFLKTIGALQPNEFPVLDQEVASTVAWCKAWLDSVYNATGVRPMIYMNQSAATGLGMGNWSSVAADYGLWLARYDNAPGTVNSVPYWGTPAMKQYTDAAPCPGVGTCDMNVFYGSIDQLRSFCKGGAAPTPTVQEDDMRLIRTPDGTIWTVTSIEVLPVANLAAANALAKICGPWQDVTFAEKDAIYLDCDARSKVREKTQQAYILGADPGPDESKWLLAQVWEIAAAVGKLQTGGVDPKTVVTGVLSGLNGAQLNVQQAPPASS